MQSLGKNRQYSEKAKAIRILIVVLSLIFSLSCTYSNEVEPRENSKFETKYYQCEDGKVKVFSSELQKAYEIQLKEIGSIAISSTTQLAFLNALNFGDKVKAVPYEKFICDTSILRRLDQGSIYVCGTIEGISVEHMIANGIDTWFLESFEQLQHPKAKKAAAAGIQLIPFMDWKESHPLARAQWLVFTGKLLNRETQADSIFSQIQKDYLAQIDTIKKSTGPIVFAGASFRDNWYLPGGRSYIAQLIADAGGRYLFASDSNVASFEYSAELAYDAMQKADLWVASSNAKSIDELLKSDSRFDSLTCILNQSVFVNNKQLCPQGGNTYYSVGVLDPARILNDFRLIFEGKEGMHYFNKLN